MENHPSKCVEKNGFLGDNFYIPNNPIRYFSNNTLKKEGNLGTLVQICLKERFNHTPVIGQKLTAFVPGFLLKPDALLLNDVESKDEQL